jgi:hypothetical protein
MGNRESSGLADPVWWFSSQLDGSIRLWGACSTIRSTTSIRDNTLTYLVHFLYSAESPTILTNIREAVVKTRNINHQNLLYLQNLEYVCLQDIIS